MLSSRFSRNGELSKNYLYRVFDECHCVRIFLGQDDSLRLNSTWNTQIDHQDGDGVLEIIGLLLSIANIAVDESCENSHGCCLCLNVYVAAVYLCVCVCMCMRVHCACDTRANVSYVWSVRSHVLSILINIDIYNVVYICVYCVYVLSPIAVRESYCM